MARITKDLLIARYLYGLDLTDDRGVPFPDEMWEWAIEVGYASARTQLDLEIDPVEFYGGEVDDADFASHIFLPQTMKDSQGRYGPESHDYWQQDSFGTLRLRRRPILEVPSKIHVVYPGSTQPIFTFPQTWLQLQDPYSGVLNIVAALNALPAQLLPSGGIYNPGGAVPLVVNTRGMGNFPNLLKVYYKAGFPPGEVPPDILHCVCLIAAMNILNPAGDLIVGAGIASTSLSFAGLSQSVNTTSSATNAGYGSRIIQYTKDLKTLIPAIRNRFHGLSLAMV